LKGEGNFNAETTQLRVFIKRSLSEKDERAGVHNI
jgi:hypothetical protein